MGEHDHLRSEHYAQVDPHGRETVARRVHDHRIALCPECGQAWEDLGALQTTFLDGLSQLTGTGAEEDVCDDDLAADSSAIDADLALLAAIRYMRRRAQLQLWQLRQLPTVDRPPKIRGAYRQFRSRALAELLIDECRATVRNAPADARSWAELVPVVLRWADGPDGPDWAPPLLALAEAHRANTLRVLGDLREAQRTFVALRRALADHPAGDPRILAEITSLEASLYIEQHRFAEADEFLERAALGYRYAGDHHALGKILIKRANLRYSQGRPAEVLELLDQAADVLRKAPAPADPVLTIATVSGRVSALCDLGRHDDALILLRSHVDDFEASEDLHAGAVFRCLDGRIALGLGDYLRAEEAFSACRDALLTLGRNHDAALACLYLAETLHAAGRMADLRELVTQLVPLFRSRDLPAETLQTLQLLARAVATQHLDGSLLGKLRDKLLGVETATIPLTG
jgi:tetratricopeptide (TPR) repeat protein